MKTIEELQAPCTCDSGKPAGTCCMKEETCPCGSGKAVSACCMAEKTDESAT